MKAIVQHSFGRPEEVLALQDVARPVPGPGEVLVRVQASSVNTPDWIAVLGQPRVLRPLVGWRRPAMPIRGSDLAGVVEAVGPDVSDLSPGDAVMGSTWTNSLRKTPGTFAELAVAPAAHLIPRPSWLDPVEAACAVMSGVTALQAFRDSAPLQPGMRVLINGASGGVGTFAVQIAAALGAHVTGVCSTRNVDLVTSLGADTVIDYTTTDLTAVTERFDVVLDNALSQPPRRLARLLADGGVLVPNSAGGTDGVLGRWFGGLPRFVGMALLGLGSRNVTSTDCEPTRANLRALLALMEDGRVRTIVDSTYAMEDAAAAVARMATRRARGNIALRGTLSGA